MHLIYSLKIMVFRADIILNPQKSEPGKKKYGYRLEKMVMIGHAYMHLTVSNY